VEVDLVRVSVGGWGDGGDVSETPNSDELVAGLVLSKTDDKIGEIFLQQLFDVMRCRHRCSHSSGLATMHWYL
jgi:hypothetical protein